MSEFCEQARVNTWPIECIENEVVGCSLLRNLQVNTKVFLDLMSDDFLFGLSWFLGTIGIIGNQKFEGIGLVERIEIVECDNGVLPADGG